MAKLPDVAEKRLEQLGAVLAGKRRLLIITHDNPDPDTIATGWVLLRLVRRNFRLRVDLAYGGTIGRGENRAMRSVLKVPLREMEDLDPTAYPAVALVDCQPETGNNSLPPGLLPTVVIDHHPVRKRTRDVPFYDVRDDYGASVTILSEYLIASGLRVDRRLATAIVYAIKTETRNLGREASRADLRAFFHFFPMVDNHALSRIEHPPIPRSYFAMMDSAMDGTRLYGTAAVTSLGGISNPDIVAEFADLMVRLEGIRWSLALGRSGPDILVSIRTNSERANAGRLIRRLLGSLGRSGGHGMMAGGKVVNGASDPEKARRVEEILTDRFLSLLHADPVGVPLLESDERGARPGRGGASAEGKSA